MDGCQKSTFPAYGRRLETPAGLRASRPVAVASGRAYPQVSRAGKDELVVVTLGSSSSPVVPIEILMHTPRRATVRLERVQPPAGVQTADRRPTAYLVLAPGLAESEAVTVELRFEPEGPVETVVLH